MGLDAQNAAEHNALPVPLQLRARQTESSDALHLEPGVGQQFGDLVDGQVEVNVFSQP